MLILCAKSVCIYGCCVMYVYAECVYGMAYVAHVCACVNTLWYVQGYMTCVIYVVCLHLPICGAYMCMHIANHKTINSKKKNWLNNIKGGH